MKKKIIESIFLQPTNKGVATIILNITVNNALDAKLTCVRAITISESTPKKVAWFNQRTTSLRIEELPLF